MTKGRNSTIPKKSQLTEKGKKGAAAEPSPKNRTVTNFSELMRLTRENYWFDKKPHYPNFDSD